MGYQGLHHREACVSTVIAWALLTLLVTNISVVAVRGRVVSGPEWLQNLFLLILALYSIYHPKLSGTGDRGGHSTDGLPEPPVLFYKITRKTRKFKIVSWIPFWYTELRYQDSVLISEHCSSAAKGEDTSEAGSRLVLIQSRFLPRYWRHGPGCGTNEGFGWSCPDSALRYRTCK